MKNNLYEWKDIVRVNGKVSVESFPISGEMDGDNYVLDDFYVEVQKKYGVDFDDVELYSVEHFAFDSSQVNFDVANCGCYVNGLPEWQKDTVALNPKPVNAEEPVTDKKEQKKTSKATKALLTMIVAISTFAILSIITLFVLNKIGYFETIEGTYKSEVYESLGMELTLKIDGDKYTMRFKGKDVEQVHDGTITIDGNKVTFDSSVEFVKLSGIYDKEAKSIAIDSIVFVKE